MWKVNTKELLTALQTKSVTNSFKQVTASLCRRGYDIEIHIKNEKIIVWFISLKD